MYTTLASVQIAAIENYTPTIRETIAIDKQGELNKWDVAICLPTTWGCLIKTKVNPRQNIPIPQDVANNFQEPQTIQRYFNVTPDLQEH